MIMSAVAVRDGDGGQHRRDFNTTMPRPDDATSRDDETATDDATYDATWVATKDATKCDVGCNGCRDEGNGCCDGMRRNVTWVATRKRDETATDAGRRMRRRNVTTETMTDATDADGDATDTATDDATDACAATKGCDGGRDEKIDEPQPNGAH